MTGLFTHGSSLLLDYRFKMLALIENVEASVDWNPFKSSISTEDQKEETEERISWNGSDIRKEKGKRNDAENRGDWRIED